MIFFAGIANDIEKTCMILIYTLNTVICIYLISNTAENSTKCENIDRNYKYQVIYEITACFFAVTV